MDVITHPCHKINVDLSNLCTLKSTQWWELLIHIDGMLQVIFDMPYHGPRRTRQARGWDDDIITTRDIMSCHLFNSLFSRGTLAWTLRDIILHNYVMAFQTTDNYIVYTKVCIAWQQGKHQSSILPAFLRETTGDIPSQRISIAESASLSWRFNIQEYLLEQHLNVNRFTFGYHMWLRRLKVKRHPVCFKETPLEWNSGQNWFR